MDENIKPVVWVPSSRRDLREFPREVQREVGLSLFRAQQGGRAPNTKILKGFGGGGVLEVVEDFDGDTYRAVYKVKFEEAVYVLHCFQKKSLRGIVTPKPDVDTIKRRLATARAMHEEYEENSR